MDLLGWLKNHANKKTPSSRGGFCGDAHLSASPGAEADSYLTLEETDRTAGRALGHLVCGCLQKAVGVLQETGSQAAQSAICRVAYIGLFQGELGAGDAVIALVEQDGTDGHEAGIIRGGSECQGADTGGKSETTVTQYAADHHDHIPLGSGLGC